MVQTLDTNLTVGDGVTIRGGYNRSTWVADGSHTTIELAGANGVDPAIHIEAPGDNVTLAGLAVVRTKGCTDTCAAIDVVNTNTTLTNVDVGTNDGGSAGVIAQGASGKVYYSVRIAGPTDQGKRITLSVTGLTTVGADSSDASTSIEIDDAVIATLSGLNLSESGSHVAAGLHTARTLGVSVDSSLVTVDADYGGHCIDRLRHL